MSLNIILRGEIMARSLRQSKILELISTHEIEKQEELVELLRQANFDITQATISRDIKELGLIKIMSPNKKYKYAYIETATEQNISSKYVNIFKESVLSFRLMNNVLMIKTIKGLASAVNSFIDKIGIEDIIGSVYGEDTVTLYFEDFDHSNCASNAVSKLMYS